MLKKKASILLVLLAASSFLILPSVQSLAKAPKRKKIPFAGMTLSYQVYQTGNPPQLFDRMVTFYGDPSDPLIHQYIWVRDSENQPDALSDDRVAKIDIKTRRIVWADSPSGDVQPGGYSEALFPRKLRVGDEVTTYWGGTVTIVGTQRMSVMGKKVDAWIAYTPTEWPGDIPVHYTMYYEKKTGIWLGGNVVSGAGADFHSWTMHLVSTNVPL